MKNKIVIFLFAAGFTINMNASDQLEQLAERYLNKDVRNQRINDACLQAGNDFMKSLKHERVDVNHETSALIVSCQQNNRKVLPTSFDVNAKDRFIDVHHLAMVSFHGCFEKAKLLLRFGANPDIQSSGDFTPLMQACRTCRPKMIELLLSAQANPNVQDKDGNTALFFMSGCNDSEKVSLRDAEIVKLLLASGANPNIKNKYELTPLKCAAGNARIKEMLKAAGATE